MTHNEHYNIALHAPNITNICIDEYDNGEISGRLYHCYTKEPCPFTNIIKLLEKMEQFYDETALPQASEQTRFFQNTSPRKAKVLTKVATPQDVAAHRGQLGTFLIHVKYRQNSSWQGKVQWIEGASTQPFMSVLELLKILTNALKDI